MSNTILDSQKLSKSYNDGASKIEVLKELI